MDKKLYKLWISRWDEKIYTFDDRENEALVKKKLMFIFSKIENILQDVNSKAILKAMKGLDIESNEYAEKWISTTKENENKPFFKHLRQSAVYASELHGTISDIYELKNRRGTEMFKLRAENATLRAELKQLKNKINGND